MEKVGDRDITRMLFGPCSFFQVSSSDLCFLDAMPWAAWLHTFGHFCALELGNHGMKPLKLFVIVGFAMNCIPNTFNFLRFLKLLNCLGWTQTCNPRALCSQRARITGLSYCGQAKLLKQWVKAKLSSFKGIRWLVPKMRKLTTQGMYWKSPSSTSHSREEL